MKDNRFEALVEYLRVELKYEGAWRPDYGSTESDWHRREGRMQALEAVLAVADRLAREKTDE
jgi:hypothetical protein